MMKFSDMRSGRRLTGVVAVAVATALVATGWVSDPAQRPGTDAAAMSADTASVAASDAPQGYLTDIESWVTTSSESGRTYQISVALPAGYSETKDPYPVLFVTDANAEFGMAVETARLAALGGQMPGAVIVGIGYPLPGQGFTASGVPRTLDLTPTSIDQGSPSGGAPEFLAFLRDELVPDIEDEFHVSDDRALMGHSFGGLFATYALLNNDGLFSRFVIGSPSIWWDDRTILAMEEEYAASADAMPARVFLSVGSVEETTSGFPMVTDMTALAQTLADRSYDGLQLGSHVFEGEDHLSVIGAGFSRGLRFVYTAPEDSTSPTVTVKTGATETIGSAATGYAKVSLKLYDAGLIDRLTVNGVAKDLTNNTYSDLNGVTPGAFGATLGENKVKVYDVAGNVTTVTFTLVTSSR